MCESRGKVLLLLQADTPRTRQTHVVDLDRGVHHGAVLAPALGSRQIPRDGPRD